jgi:hypothetical protein
MGETVLVRPRPGLILDGIPATGAAIPQALADEWVANRMVEPAPPDTSPRRRLGALVTEPATPTAVITKAPVRRRRRKTATAVKRRRTK